MFSYEIRIPRDRVAVLIGKDGEMKQQLEDVTDSKISVDSQEGIVTVTGDDAVQLFATQNIIKAIARGFNPEVALRLTKQDWAFELIELSDYSTKKNQHQRMKGRVIGHGGKARTVIEDLTDSSISVYGKTIGIIAPIETLPMAKQAITSLLEGAQHSNVYKTLERKRRDMRLTGLMGSAPGSLGKQ